MGILDEILASQTAQGGPEPTAPEPQTQPAPAPKNPNFLRSLLTDFIGTLAGQLKEGSFQQAVGKGIQAGTARGGTAGQAFGAAFGTLPEATMEREQMGIRNKQVQAQIEQQGRIAEMTERARTETERHNRATEAQAAATLKTREGIAAAGIQSKETIAKLQREMRMGQASDGDIIEDADSPTGYSRQIVNRNTREVIGFRRGVPPPASQTERERISEQVVTLEDGSLIAVPIRSVTRPSGATTGTQAPSQRGVRTSLANIAQQAHQGIIGRVVGRRPATTESTVRSEAARSGLRALDRFENLLGVVRDESGNVVDIKNTSLIFKSSMPGGLGGREALALKKEAADVQTRIRTGAALNREEQEFYISQLPSVLDITEPEAIATKLNILREYFSALAKMPSFANPRQQGGEPNVKQPIPFRPDR